MRYVVARFNQHQRDMAYRFYLCEANRTITENTANMVYILSRGKIEGKIMAKSFKDVLYSDIDEREPQEIVDDVLDELKLNGLEVIN